MLSLTSLESQIDLVYLDRDAQTLADVPEVLRAELVNIHLIQDIAQLEKVEIEDVDLIICSPTFFSLEEAQKQFHKLDISEKVFYGNVASCLSKEQIKECFSWVIDTNDSPSDQKTKFFEILSHIRHKSPFEKSGSVGSIMSKNLRCISVTHSVREAIEIMAGQNIGALIVADGLKPLGIFTERDFLMCYRKLGPKVEDLLMKEFERKDLITIRPEQPIDIARICMVTGRFRHLPVVKHGLLVGVLSIRDIADYYADNPHLNTRKAG
jgi:CBS domain-containing protein